MSPRKPGSDAPDLLKLRRKLDLTQTEMADKLGVTLRMYQKYEKGVTPLSRPVAKLVELIRAGKY